jgi:tryptophan synthase alpha chain
VRAEAPPKRRLTEAFEGGLAQGRALLMPYLICGYPSRSTFVDVASAAADAGTDLFELGIPFSDPIMDGPVIQAAAARVLEEGMRTDEALELVARVVERTGRPAVAMTYYNVVFRAGLERFAGRLAEAGAAGAIIPDLSVEEAGPWIEACSVAGIAPVFMVAPTSTPERIALIAQHSEGFVYAASTLGVTGVRDELSSGARKLVESIRAVTDTPVAVGIGVSSPEQAHEVASYADGVIVGSALVRRIGETSEPAAEAAEFTSKLRKALNRG